MSTHSQQTLHRCEALNPADDSIWQRQLQQGPGYQGYLKREGLLMKTSTNEAKKARVLCIALSSINSKCPEVIQLAATDMLATSLIQEGVNNSVVSILNLHVSLLPVLVSIMLLRERDTLC
jgi:hypothetical protein